MWKRYSSSGNVLLRNFATQAQAAQKPKREWKSVVGLEVHAQISSESKLFSASGTAFGLPLNSAVSCFDASVPGTLPVLNKKCVEYGVKTALALNCKVNEVSMFDRKHYFYADLPTGYQITQQRSALANNGELRFPVIMPTGNKIYYKTVKLLQLQLEQDSGKSLHDEELKRSLVDLNRAGIPLMELVFSPDLETGEEAAALVKELILILKRLGTCSCKMEEGALRVDANISIHKEGEPFGTRTEVKNISSLRSISQAISYEIDRQIEIVNNGGVVTNETRSWDAETHATVAMRDKEVLQDYRFMPEPNLPPLRLKMKKADAAAAEADDYICVEAIKETLTELPETTRTKLIEIYKMKQDTAIILVNETFLLNTFLSIATNMSAVPTKTITNFLINDYLTFCNKKNIDVADCNTTAEHLRSILKSLHAGEINLQSARKLIEFLHDDASKSVDALIDEHNLHQISDMDKLKEICQQAIQNQPNAVKKYKSGKTKAMLAIIGEIAKLTDDKANMKLATACLEKLLQEKQ